MEDNSKNKNKIMLSGLVTKIINSNSIMVELENNLIISCYLSKRLKKLNIIIGDKVDIELTPYDLNKGKIIHRYTE